MIKKIVALALTYSFWATSLWALTPSQYLPAVFGGHYAASAPVRSLAALNAMNRAMNAGTAANMAKSAYTPKIFSNLAELNAAAVDGQAGGGATTTFNFFGPQEYVRTTGDPNTYVTTVSVPAWIASPFNLHIQSGEADGTYRVSSATVSVNSTQVAIPTDFNQQVFTLDRSVTLTPTTTLTVTLASKPGSYLRINLAGVNQDHTAPSIKVDLPGAINNTQPRLVVEYQDAAGAGEPAASGVDTTTLKISVDGVDRTSLFTKRTTDADASWPASLAFAPGPHTIVASIQDLAGNVGQTTLPFQVDLTPPSLQIIAPVASSYLSTTAPTIQLAYSDNLVVDSASVKVLINGADRSNLFTKTATGATAVLDASSALPQGANNIVATVSDTAGNQTTSSVSFNVDIQPPVISIVHPSQNSRHGSSSVEFAIEYSDDQAVDVSTLKVTLDGNALTVSAGAATATATSTLGDGSHTVTASIKDKAGNTASTSSSFSVDTAAPAIHITAPAAGAILNSGTQQVQVTYSDTDLDISTFHFFIDGVEQTALFSVTPTGASAAAITLGEGTHTLAAQISDLTGNQGATSNSIVIDTIKPAITVVAPTGAVNTAKPSALIQYSDSGSGVDLATLHIALDGSDVTASFSTAANSAAGILGAGTPLAEGTHQLQVSIADKAGNVASITPGAQFTVDLTPPQGRFTSPANDSFTNNTQPTITLSYSDALSGVDPNSVHVFLQQGTAAETEVTQLFNIAASQASATVPAASALTEGTYHLRAQVADKAGNVPPTPVQSTFVVDTTAPTCTIEAPAANAYLKSATPSVQVACHDDNSGIDPTKFSVLLDGTDVTAQLTGSETGITGSFAALADGSHNLQVTAFDRAGNQAATQTAQFLVDTTAPAISITAPANAAFTNNNHSPVAVTFSDGGSGIDVTSFKLTIDGVDHTAEFTTTLTGSTGTPVVALTEGTHIIVATISDLAANPNSSTVTYIVDTIPPQIAIAQPQDGSFTNETSVVVSGTVTDASAVTLTIEGVSVPLSGGAFTSAGIALGAGPTQAIHISATDAAGNNSSSTVNVNIDRVPPTITFVVTPTPNPAGWNNTDVTVSFTCTDDRSGVATCPLPVSVASEGANQIITGVATDRAGNSAPASVHVSIDKTPPLVTATAAPQASAGWNNSNVTVTFTCTDSLSGIASCPPTTVVSTEGQNQTVAGQAVDIAGNTAPTGITLSIDKTPPTFLTLLTPDHISRLHGGQVSATVSDNFTVTQVVLSVNGTPLGTFTAAPYQANLQVPAGSNPGDTLTVTATATDQAGNTSTSSRSVRVAADGVIVGQVLDDVTGFPLESANVQVISQTGATDQTDRQGRYSLQGNDPHLFLSVTGSATGQPTTTVEREVFVQEGVGTVPVDARLTTLATAVSIGSAGGSLKSDPITVSVPPATVSDSATFRLTPLSGQGLPGLLPLGWSPLAAFDLKASAAAANLPATIASTSTSAAYLAGYDFSLHAWTILAQNLQPLNGGFSVTLPGPGSFALVVPDVVTPPVTIPAVGDPLIGINVQVLSPTASSSGSVSPAVLPPSGGTATATLGVQSPTFVPSGTVIQANVSEKFSLKSGDVVSEQTRSEDIVLYNALAPTNNTTGALFPIAPSHKFSNGDVLTGRVHLDFLSGREGVRGQPGGNDPLTVSDGITTLSVPGNSLALDTAVSIESIALEDFIPTTSSMNALQEAVVDFSGEILNVPAQLSISATGLNPADTFLLAEVQRLNGVPHLAMIALAQISGNTLTSVASPGLPGILHGGEYVFYDFPSPIGFAAGFVNSSAGPIAGALVQLDTLPMQSITGADGHYIVPALAGAANLKAGVPGTSLAGTATATIPASQTVPVNITLVGTVTSATVSPADGTLGVPVSTQITVTTSAALDPSSIVQSNLVLLQGTGTAQTSVPLRGYVLSTSGTVLSFAPQANLNPATSYTVQVTGLRDVFQNPVVVPQSTFATKAAQALTFDPNAITFSFPDANGNIHVSAPAGSLPPGTQVLIVDQTSGLVLSLTAGNDGSVSGNFLGTINDVLQVTVTDPLGASASFTRSQFVAVDGTVAVGAGGGTVTGTGGVELRVPAGSLDNAVQFQIQSFGGDKFVDRPPLPGSNFGGGLEIKVDHIATYSQEIKVAFPKPADAPDDAFYYVYRRLVGPNGAIAYETLDHAFVEGTGATAKVVTASPPFPGYNNNNGTFALDNLGAVVLGGALITDLVLAWTVNPAGPGIPLPGIITGKVLRPVLVNGQPQFQGVNNVAVTATDTTGRPLFDLGLGTTHTDGTFVLWAPFFHTGDTILLRACDSGQCAQASTTELTVLDTNNLFTFAGPLFKYYKNVAAANITLPALPPQAPPSQIALSVGTRGAGSSVSPISGPVLAGTTVVISAKVNSTDPSQILQVQAGTLQGQPYAVTGDPSDPTNFLFSPDFTPATPGLYTVTATAIPPTGGSPISARATFLVISAGGSNSQVLNGQAPDVITSQLVPKPGSIGVPVNILPQVVFSEPVNNVASSVVLRETDSAGASDGNLVPVKISGLGVVFDAQGNSSNIALDTVSDGDNIGSITIQPLNPLKYNTYYKISLSNGITDLDKDANGQPAPNHLAGTPPNRDFFFQTFGPQQLSETDVFNSPRIVVLNNRAYVTKSASVNSQLFEYDVTDPVHPSLVTDPGATQFVTGRAQDLAGEDNFSPEITGLVGVATGVGALSLPSNIFFYDVSDPVNIRRVGAVSVTGSAGQEGTILHMVMKDTFAYTTTTQKGIQVVDINQAINNYSQAVATDIVSFGTQITTEGQGFGRDAVINTIPVMTNVFGTPAVPATLYGLAAGTLTLDQQAQTLVVATGIESLVVADPIAGQVISQQTHLVAPNGTMQRGFMIALGTISGPCTNGLSQATTCDVAAVVGTSDGGSPILVEVDMSNPRSPVALGALQLESTAFDVLIQNDVALVALADKTVLVDLKTPSSPTVIGEIDGVGGRLSLNGFLFGTAGGGTAGLHVATLGALAYVKSFDPKFIVVSPANELFTDVKINYAIIPPIPDITTAEVHIDAQGRVATLPGPVASGTGTVTWPSGTIIQPALNYFATVHAQFNGSELPTIATRVPFVRPTIAVQSHDRMVRIQVALPDQQLFKDNQGNPIDKFTVKLFLKSNPASGDAPDFQVTSTDITNAYVNADCWWNTQSDCSGTQITDGSTIATRPWVTRKILMFKEAQGVSNPVKMQAYEIGTVVPDTGTITVVIFSEVNQTEVQRHSFTLTPDGNWSAMIQNINEKINPGTSCPSGTPCPTRSLLFRVLHSIDQAQAQFGLGLVRGFFDGLKEGYENNIFNDPIGKAKSLLNTAVALSLWQFYLIKKLVELAKNPDQLKAIMQNTMNVLRAAAGALPYTLDLLPIFGSLAGYGAGFLVGLLTWMAFEFVVIGALTAGVGDLVELAGDAAEAASKASWVSTLAGNVLAFIGSLLIIMTEWASAAVGAPIAEETLLAIVEMLVNEATELLEVVRDIYQMSGPVLKAFGQMLAKIDGVTEAFVKSVDEALLEIPKMLDTAFTNLVGKLIPSLEGKLGMTATAQLLSRWAEVFHLGTGINELMTKNVPDLLDWSVGALEGGFIAGSKSDPSEQLISKLVDKYSTDAKNVLFTLKPQSQDGTYTDQTIVETVRLLVDSSLNLPVFSADPNPAGKNAVAGMAKLIQAECSLP